MGLDITAFSGAKLLPAHVNLGTWCEVEDHVQAYAYASFPRSFRGLADPDKVFGGMIGGRCYDVSESKRHAFRAGSYSGYGHWRARLSDTFKVNGPEDPFYELVHFADNEGCIGPEAAIDLYGDFVAHKDAWVAECGNEDTWHLPVYDDWTLACELAADNGFIEFH